MTASTLTPEEQLHVDAIGLHDMDVLSEMEEHADDVAACNTCGGEATHVMVCRNSCGNQGLICSPCLLKARHAFRFFKLTCALCGFEGYGLDELAKVVPL